VEGCDGCHQPLRDPKPSQQLRLLFKQKENHLYAWRSSSGKLYCSEFCADDEEEATFQNMRT
jgi:hypothetical protein